MANSTGRRRAAASMFEAGPNTHPPVASKIFSAGRPAQQASDAPHGHARQAQSPDFTPLANHQRSAALRQLGPCIPGPAPYPSKAARVAPRPRAAGSPWPGPIPRQGNASRQRGRACQPSALTASCPARGPGFAGVCTQAFRQAQHRPAARPTAHAQADFQQTGVIRRQWYQPVPPPVTHFLSPAKEQGNQRTQVASSAAGGTWRSATNPCACQGQRPSCSNTSSAQGIAPGVHQVGKVMLVRTGEQHRARQRQGEQRGRARIDGSAPDGRDNLPDRARTQESGERHHTHLESERARSGGQRLYSEHRLKWSGATRASSRY